VTIEQINPGVIDEPRGKVAWQDSRLALLGAGVLVLLIALSQWLWFLQPLRLALGLAYVLFVPGYCLTAALFPRADDIDGIERVGLSLGLSVAWVSVLALILDWLPWGLRLWPIVLGELLSILLFMAVALWRRARLPAAAAYAPDLAWRPRPWWRDLPQFERRIYGLAAGALLVAGLAAAWIFLVPTPSQFMTEFYMLGADGLAESYPRQAAVGQDLGVTLGVMNHERAPASYRVEVWAVDPWTEDRRQLVAQAGPIELAVGSGREWPIAWQMPWVGDDQVVELLLFSGDGAEPYRSLRLWMNVTEPSPARPVQELPAVAAPLPTAALPVTATLASTMTATPAASPQAATPAATPTAAQPSSTPTAAPAAVQPSPTPSPTPRIVVVSDPRGANLRAAPAVEGELLAIVSPGVRLTVTGVSDDSAWLQVCCVAGLATARAWIWRELVAEPTPSPADN
jgi:uncharacterized membrane protein